MINTQFSLQQKLYSSFMSLVLMLMYVMAGPAAGSVGECASLQGFVCFSVSEISKVRIAATANMINVCSRRQSVEIVVCGCVKVANE